MGGSRFVDLWRHILRQAAQDEHASGDERDFYLLRTASPLRYLTRDGFPPRSTVYNTVRKVQAE